MIAGPDVRTILTEDRLFDVESLSADERAQVDGLEAEFPDSAYDYYQFKTDAATTLHPHSIVEIGVWRGYGAACMLHQAPWACYLGIDLPPETSPYIGHRQNLEHAARLLEAHDAQILLCDSTAIHQLPAFDLAHVDGGHAYETALSDIRLCMKTCRHILIDDTHYEPIRRAYDECRRGLEEIAYHQAEDTREQALCRVI